MTMHIILRPATREAALISPAILVGTDTAGATVIDVTDDFSWSGKAIDWDALSIIDDITPLRTAKVAAVCDRAETLRGQYITMGSGQALTYQRKEAEARAWTEGADMAAYPMLAAECASTGMAIADLVALVIQQADAWLVIGSAIEAARRGLLVRIEAAATAAELDAIDIEQGWPT